MDFPFGVPFLQVAVLMPVWADGTLALVISLFLVNLLVLLEVADRLSLKGELEVAREIQLAMLPKGTYRAGDIEICGMTRPANTVGGDFYDVLPLRDGRIIVTLGDVAGKGSPAALLMALLLAVLRTLVDEELDAAGARRASERRRSAVTARRRASSRCSMRCTSPATGALTYVNAGQNPPMIRRRDGRYERLGSTGVALGMFDHSTFGAVDTTLEPGETLVMYSDGITEAEDPAGRAVRRVGTRGRGRTERAGRTGGDWRAGAEGGRGPREGVAVHRRPDNPAAEARMPAARLIHVSHRNANTRASPSTASGVSLIERPADRSPRIARGTLRIPRHRRPATARIPARETSRAPDRAGRRDQIPS